MNFTLGTYGPRQVYILGYSMTNKLMAICLHDKDTYAVVNNAYTAFSSDNKNATTSIVLNHQQAPKILDDYIAHPNKYGFIVILPNVDFIKQWFLNAEVMSGGFENPVHIDINTVMRIVKPVSYEETFESVNGDATTKIRCKPYTLSSSYEWSDLYLFIKKLFVLAPNPQARIFYNLLSEQIANSEIGGWKAPSLKNIASTEMISYAKPVTGDIIRERINSIANNIRCGLEFSIIKTSIGVPMIDRIIFNNPSTVVFWTDGTKTVVTAMDGDEFSKEYGLAMAIAKKYFSCYDSKHPRAVFKKSIEKADDYSGHTIAVKERRERKKLKQLEAAKKESENVTEATDISE